MAYGEQIQLGLFAAETSEIFMNTFLFSRWLRVVASQILNLGLKILTETSKSQNNAQPELFT